MFSIFCRNRQRVWAVKRVVQLVLPRSNFYLSQSSSFDQCTHTCFIRLKQNFGNEVDLKTYSGGRFPMPEHLARRRTGRQA
jgi:hypothetical protein